MRESNVETWREVVGYEGLYAVSDDGKILGKTSGKILKPSIRKDGYNLVVLSKEGVTTSHYVHRIVAKAFVYKPEDHYEVNHIDENKCNNFYENLEWCTRQYNVEYSKAKSYSFISPEGVSVEVYNLCKFCRENKLHNGHMYSVHSGDLPHHKQWRRDFEKSHTPHNS